MNTEKFIADMRARLLQLIDDEQRATQERIFQEGAIAGVQFLVEQIAAEQTAAKQTAAKQTAADDGQESEPAQET